jgi:hypothetical protein
VSVRRWLGCVLLLAALETRSGAAEPAPPDAPEACGGAGPETLEVLVKLDATGTLAPSDTDSALRRAICDWFREDRWRVRFSSRAPETARAPSALRIAIELPSPHSARLNADGPGGRWTHDVPLAAGLDDAGVEAVAEALHSTTQAELAPPLVAPARPAAAGTAAAAPEPAAARADPDVPLLQPAPVTAAGEPSAAPQARASGRHLPVHTALGYQAYARGPEPVMHGPMLHIELDALSSALTLGASFRASLFTSATRRTTGFDVRTSGTSLSLGGAASVALDDRLRARAGLGGGVDLVAVAARVNDPELVRLLPDRDTSLRPFAGAEAGLRYRAGPFEVALDGLLRLLFFETQYQVLTPDGPVTLFQPWQLQPGALLELAYVW